MHSPFEGMTAEETFNSHKATLRGLRIRGILITVVLGAAGIWGVERGWMWLYVAGLGGILVTVFSSAPHGARDGAAARRSLAGCGRRQYRAVLEMGLARTRRRSTRAALELELAFCDYFDGLDGAALERIQGLTFRGRKNTQRLRCFDLEALLFDACGDVARRDEALGASARWRRSIGPAPRSPRRRAISCAASSSASHLLRSGLKEMHGSFANRWSLRTSG